MDSDTRNVLKVSVGGHFLVDLYSPILPIILPALITDMGLSFLLAGILVTVFNITSSIVQPFAGLYSDKTGKKADIPLCVLLSATGICLAALVQNYWLMIVLIAVAALGNALFHPSAMDSIYRIASPANRGSYNSIFTTSGSISYSFGPLLAGILVTFFGVSSVFWLIIPGILGAIWIFITNRKITVREPEKVTKKYTPESSVRKKYWWAPAGLVVTLCSLRAWAYIAVITYLPTLLILEHREMDTITTSFIVMIMLLTGVVGQIAGGNLSDKFGRKNMLIFGFIGAIPFFAMIFLGTGLLMYFGVFMYAFFASFCYVTSVTMVQELLPGSVGFASGLTLGFSIGVGGIGAALTGYLADIMGSLSDAMFLLIIPTIICPIFALFIRYPEYGKINGSGSS